LSDARTPEDRNVVNPVVYFEIMGKDADALRAFYRAAFGWQIGEPVGGAGTGDYTFVEPGGRGGISGGIGSMDGYDGHMTFYVRVPDVEAALVTIERCGGSRLVGPQPVPSSGDIIGLARDPEGHVIGLVAPKALEA
jgi:hypothetical protein